MGNIYTGVNNVARRIKNVYVGVNGVARKVKMVYTGVDNVARKVWSSGTIKEMLYAIGASTYKLRMTNDFVNFQEYDSAFSDGVVQRGNTLYRISIKAGTTARKYTLTLEKKLVGATSWTVIREIVTNDEYGMWITYNKYEDKFCITRVSQYGYIIDSSYNGGDNYYFMVQCVLVEGANIESFTNSVSWEVVTTGLSKPSGYYFTQPFETYYSNGVYYFAVAYFSGSNNYYRVAYKNVNSPTSTWQLTNPTNVDRPTFGRNLLHFNGYYFCEGNINFSNMYWRFQFGDTFTAPNGVTEFRDTGMPGISNIGVHRVLKHNNTLYYIIGDYVSSSGNLIKVAVYSSTDGVTFTQVKLENTYNLGTPAVRGNFLGEDEKFWYMSIWGGVSPNYSTVYISISKTDFSITYNKVIGNASSLLYGAVSS